MLDGIEKQNRNKHSASIDDLNRAVEQKRINTETISDFKDNRTKIIHLKGSSQKVALTVKKPQKKGILGSLVFAIGLLAVVGLLCLGATNTYPYKALRLVYLLKNGTYLIGFQNSAELRPTGGFWGSFALWKVNSSVLNTSILFETNPYKNDNPLLKTTDVELPKPMKDSWANRPQSFVNANWPFDFEQAAKTIQWYLGKGWDQQADGVVAVSSLSMIDLLKLTGPIQIEGQQISSENFTQFMSQKIDTEYWQDPENVKTNEPKTIVKNLFPIIVEKTKLLPKKDLLHFALDQSKKGRLLLYFNDSKKQKLVEQMGLSGKVISSKCDYISINNANINGGKSSLNILQSIDYEVSSDGAGNIAEVTIERKWPTKSWPNVLNSNYTRAIAPLGSKLISASLGQDDITDIVDFTEESGRSTFGFWFSVDQEESKTATIRYELPFSQQKNDYSLVIQKQPGTLPDNLNVTVFGQKIYEGMFDQNSLYLP